LKLKYWLVTEQSRFQSRLVKKIFARIGGGEIFDAGDLTLHSRIARVLFLLWKIFGFFQFMLLERHRTLVSNDAFYHHNCLFPSQSQNRLQFLDRGQTEEN